MQVGKSLNSHKVTTIGFVFLSAYILSFVFEGQVLYNLIENSSLNVKTYVIVAIAAHFIRLFTGGFFIKTEIRAKSAMLTCLSLCLIFTIPYFFKNPFIWLISIIVSGFASGYAVAVWGFFLKAYTPKNKRIKTCANVLIYSNVLMILLL